MISNAKSLPDRRKSENPKRGSRLPYAISYVRGVKCADLTSLELSNLQKALRRTPGDAIRQTYAYGLDAYVFATKEYAKASPAKVYARLNSVLCCGQKLHKAIAGLTLTDKSYIGSFFTRRFLRNLPCVSENELWSALTLFLGDVGDAVNELDATQRKGSMPAHAARALALTIAQGLYLESNKFPPLTRGGDFDRVLKCALDACDSRSSRIRPHADKERDVMELMRAARDTFDPQEAQQFGTVLNHLATPKPQS